MGAFVVIEVAQLLASVVGICVGAQQIVRAQQQTVRVASAEARIAVAGGALQFYRRRRREASTHDSIGNLEMARPPLLDRLEGNIRKDDGLEIFGYPNMSATRNVESSIVKVFEPRTQPGLAVHSLQKVPF